MGLFDGKGPPARLVAVIASGAARELWWQHADGSITIERLTMERGMAQFVGLDPRYAGIA